MDNSIVEDLLKQAKKNNMRSVPVPWHYLKLLCRFWLDNHIADTGNKVDDHIVDVNKKVGAIGVETGGNELWVEKNPAYEMEDCNA